MSNLTKKFAHWQAFAREILHQHDEAITGLAAHQPYIQAVRENSLKLLYDFLPTLFNGYRLIVIGSKGCQVCFFDPHDMRDCIQKYREIYPLEKDYLVQVIPFEKWFKANEVFTISDVTEKQDSLTKEVRGFPEQNQNLFEKI